MAKPFDWKSRGRAAGLHLLISAAIAAVAALLVFVFWYPGQFRELAGGRGLFFLVTSVDVVLGPLLTFAVFNRAKGKRHLAWDLGVIAALQIGALAYGMNTVFAARPIAMVFEVDRFRLVTAADVYRVELPQAPPQYRELPWTGPWLLGTRPPVAGAERNDALFTALDGVDISSRPRFWRPYEQSRSDALGRARPLSVLMARDVTNAGELRQRLRQMHADEATARFLPAVARGDWVAVLDNAGEMLGYLPVDGFF